MSRLREGILAPRGGQDVNRKALQRRQPWGIGRRCPSSTTPHSMTAAMATRAATMVKVGSWRTATPLKKKEPPPENGEGEQESPLPRGHPSVDLHGQLIPR